jgi:hypothetical protein
MVESTTFDSGSLGQNTRGGAFRARLHFREHSKIHISIRAQSEFEEFGMQSVASEATLYFTTEPILLDNFIADLRAVKAGLRDEAKLEAA